MHLTEFKAWFEGYTEEMKNPPNKDQWKKIKKRVAEITADYTPAPVFVERYYKPYYPYWTWGTFNMSTTNGQGVGSSLNNSITTDTYQLTLEDWHKAGQAEYQAE